jgi:hypothetical protein
MHTALTVVIGVSAAAVLFTVVHLVRSPAVVKPVSVAPVPAPEPLFVELELESEVEVEAA